MSRLRAVPMLSLNQVDTYYGQIHALKQASLEINQGEIVSLIGANGAGKSTLLMTICGQPHPSAGAIHFQGQQINNLAPHQIAALGIAQVPEGRRIFSRLTVLENLKMGAILAKPENYSDDLDRMFDLFPRLSERQHQRGGTLSGGEQQMLAIARALMSRPSLLLLDEPSLGLAPIVVQQIFSILKQINQQQMTLFLVEQNAHQALKLADRAYVLRTGNIILTGTGEELLSNLEVQSAYL